MLAKLLEVLRAAGVREAHFHPDGKPAHLVFGPNMTQPADPGGEKKPHAQQRQAGPIPAPPGAPFGLKANSG